jgi:hypothetical protein
MTLRNFLRNTLAILTLMVSASLYAHAFQSSEKFRAGDIFITDLGTNEELKKATITDVTRDGLVQTNLSPQYFGYDRSHMIPYKPVNSYKLPDALGKLFRRPPVIFKVGDYVFYSLDQGKTYAKGKIVDLVEIGLMELDTTNGVYIAIGGYVHPVSTGNSR